MGETERRRKIQLAYNEKHGITPKTILKAIRDITETMQSEHQKTVSGLLKLDEAMLKKNPKGLIRDREKKMENAVKILDFETAAILRDEIRALEEKVIEQEKAQEAKKVAATLDFSEKKPSENIPQNPNKRLD